MQDAEWKVRNTNLDAGCWMLDAGCWMLDAGCVGVGNWKQETNFITLRTL